VSERVGRQSGGNSKSREVAISNDQAVRFYFMKNADPTTNTPNPSMPCQPLVRRCPRSLGLGRKGSLVLAAERAAYQRQRVIPGADKQLTLGELGLTTGRLAEDSGARAALNDSGSV
jgi:hypothetical protein